MGVGVGVHAGGDAQEDCGLDPPAVSQLVELCHLVEVIHDETAHAPLQGLSQFLRALVIAVKVDLLAGEIGGLSNKQLAPGDHVEAHPLVAQQPGQADAQVRLAGVEHLTVGVQAMEAAHIPLALIADGQFVEDVQGCPVFSSQRHRVAPTDLQVVEMIHSRRIR